MRRLVAVLVLAAMLPGCMAVSRRSRATGALADVMAVAGFVLVAKNAGCEEGPPPMPPPVAVPVPVFGESECLDNDLAVVGGVALLVLGGLIGTAVLLDAGLNAPPLEQPVEPGATIDPPIAPSDDDDALRLAKQAQRAYAAGDCAGTRASLDALAAHDAAYHAELVGVTGYGGFAGCL